MKIKPLQGKVILKPIKKEEKTKTGLILPNNTNKDKAGIGVILNTCKGSDLKAGQEVLFSQYSPSQIKFEGEDYLIIEETDILAIIKKNDTKKNS